MTRSVGPLFLHRPRKGLPPPPSRSHARRLPKPEPAPEPEPEPEPVVMPEPAIEVELQVGDIQVIEEIPAIQEVEPTPEPPVAGEDETESLVALVVDEAPPVVLKPKVSMLTPKTELIAAAEGLGLKTDSTMTKREILALIEAA